jgi:hypothetical protein
MLHQQPLGTPRAMTSPRNYPVLTADIEKALLPIDDIPLFCPFKTL